MKIQNLSMLIHLFLIFSILILSMQSAFAATNSSIPDFEKKITPEEKATYDKFLEPFYKIYNLLRYIAFAALGVSILYAAFLFMGSGTDISKREKAKAILVGAFIGLVLILGAPLIFEYLVG